MSQLIVGGELPAHAADSYAQVLEQTLGILQDGKKLELQKILELKGDEAQDQLDILQSIADSPRPLTPRVRFLTLKTIYHLSQDSGRYPRCYAIKNLKIGRPIARGTFGNLYKGTIEANGQDENTDDKFYAVKVVQLYPGSVGIKDCLREAILWRQLKHPNVLPFLGMYYLDESQQDVCFVSPYMDKGSLFVILKTQPPADEDMYTLVHDIACGLTYLHGEKIIHGDLKDHNVLITDGSRASLCDFGQSRLATATGFKSSKPQGGGTPGFVAPEVSKSGHSSNEGDVYAFGRLCFQILKKMYGLPDLRWLSEDSHEVDPTRPEGLPSRRDLDLMWDMILKCLDGKASLRPDAKKLVSLVDEMSLRKIIPPPDWDDLDSSFMRLRSNASLPANQTSPMTTHSAAPVSLPDGGHSPLLIDRTAASDTNLANSNLVLASSSTNNREKSGLRSRFRRLNPLNLVRRQKETKKPELRSTSPSPDLGIPMFYSTRLPGIGGTDGVSAISRAGSAGGLGSIGGGDSNDWVPSSPLIGDGWSSRGSRSEETHSYRAKALYAYTASLDDPNEISFYRGEILDIIDRQGKWWHAKKSDGTVGIAPSNYLQVI